MTKTTTNNKNNEAISAAIDLLVSKEVDLWVKLQKRGKSELQTINSLYFVLIYLHFIKISYNKLSCLNTTCLRRNSICS